MAFSEFFQKHFFLVRLVHSQWSGKTRDREEESKLCNDAQAAKGSARIWKNLVHDAYKPYVKEWGKLFNYFYSAAYQWPSSFGEHFYLVPVKGYDAFIEKIRELKATLDRAEEKFLLEYAEAVAKEEARLGRLFKDKDYPSVAEMRTKFHTEIIVRPVPVVSNVITEVADEQIEKIKAELESEEQEMLKAFHAESLQRLLNPLKRLSERLDNSNTDRDKIFRDSLIRNIKESVNTVRQFNVAGEKSLDDLCSEIETALCSIKPEHLRHSANLSTSTKNVADTLAKKIESYL